MRLFCIWNRAYKTTYVAAPSIEEALKLAVDAGKLRRLNSYRRFLDVTDQLAGEDRPVELAARLKENRSGVLSMSEQGWQFI